MLNRYRNALIKAFRFFYNVTVNVTTWSLVDVTDILPL